MVEREKPQCVLRQTVYCLSFFDGKVKKDGEGNIVTKKQDRENHGIGSTSIRKTLTKYNGFMNVEMEDKKYRLTGIMYHTNDKL